MLLQILETWKCASNFSENPQRVSANVHEQRPILRLLRSRRRRHGISLSNISQELGISIASAFRYETGQRIPGSQLLKDLSELSQLQTTEYEILKASLEGAPDTKFDTKSRLVMTENSVAYPPHIAFEELDRLYCFQNLIDPDEMVDRIYKLSSYLTQTGDMHSVLECHSLLRDFIVRASSSSPRLSIEGIHALAKINLEPKISVREGIYKRYLSKVTSAPESKFKADANFALVRMAEIMEDFSVADELLDQIESINQDWLTEDTRSYVRLHRYIIEFGFERSNVAISKIERFLEQTPVPSQKYTANVALMSMFATKRDIANVTQCHDRCTKFEQFHGFGSPLSQKISARLNLFA